jgi:hypothetical protein
VCSFKGISGKAIKGNIINATERARVSERARKEDNKHTNKNEYKSNTQQLAVFGSTVSRANAHRSLNFIGNHKKSFDITLIATRAVVLFSFSAKSGIFIIITHVRSVHKLFN